MADVRWTAEQLEAIETRGKNLLVSAGAGAGKTAVLVERVMRMITDPVSPVPIDRILVVTFTNAAAAEMRMRIGKALQDALKADPHSALLNRQIALFDQAAITTMHSFCLDTVRRYFDLINLDPAFRVGDEHELSLLRLDVLAELFEAQYKKPESNERFSRLVDIYGGEKGDQALQELVLTLYDFARSTPQPRRWFAKALEQWDVDDSKTLDDLPWAGDLLREIRSRLDIVLALMKQAVKIAELREGPGVYLKVLLPELEHIERLIRAGEVGWTELAKEFNELAFLRLPPCRDGNKALKEQAAGLRRSAKEELQRLAATYFSRQPDEWLRDMRVVYPVLRDLVCLVGEFDEAYAAAKRDRGLVDFGDLEHLCLEILSDNKGEIIAPSAIALELREWYEEIVVDEYQDINGIQETILKMVSRQDDEQPNLFLVGDVKQSIYRFRLAEPDLFLQKYHTYPPLRDAAGTDARIDLSLNFRSRPAIIDAVNFVFRRIMSVECGEMEYDKAAELNCGVEYPPESGTNVSCADQVELIIIERAPGAGEMEGAAPVENSEDEAEDDVYEAAEAEALLVASRIRELISGTPEQGPARIYDHRLRQHREITYKDIAILLRSTKGWANTFVEVFHRYGIPVFADLGSGYFAATEVETMLSLLSVVDNPHQDVPLAGVLRSPLFGFSASDLAAIRTSLSSGDFYACVKASAEKDGVMAERLQAFLLQLERWRTFARRKPLPELIRQIYRDTGYYEFVGGLPGGAQRQANLRALHNHARRYERTSYRGLFRFLRFIERVREKGDDLGTARPLGENEDVVRVMSVHRSKGLEFPVVILAGLGRRFNFRDCSREVLLHKNLGLAAEVVDPELRLRYPTLLKHLVRAQVRKESLAEEMRILYVAMTRARERLLLIGSGKPEQLFKSSALRVSSELDRLDVLKAGSYLRWIALALIDHPDARPLVTTAMAMPSRPKDEPSRWEIRIVNSADLPRDTSSKACLPPDSDVVSCLKRSLPVKRAAGAEDEVKRRLEWNYPWRPETVRPAKLAATELLQQSEPAAFDAVPIGPYRPKLIRHPRFMQETAPLGSAEYGSVIHLVMQHIDWNATDPEEVRQEIERMAASEIISAKQRDAVDCSVIARFLQSDLACRIRNGLAFQREVPFTFKVPAHRFYADVKADEDFVLIQGVIDGLLTERDGFVIIDYKTDRVPSGDERVVADRYRRQLDLYAQAVESITHGCVKEKYIYLFDAGTAVQV